VVIATRQKQAKALDLDKYMTKDKWCCCRIESRKIPARIWLAPTATAANGLPNLLERLLAHSYYARCEFTIWGKPQARTLAAMAQQDEQIKQQEKFVRDEARAKKKEVALHPAVPPHAVPTPRVWPMCRMVLLRVAYKTPKAHPDVRLQLCPVRTFNGRRIVTTEGS
jgi:hypothetical protein